MLFTIAHIGFGFQLDEPNATFTIFSFGFHGHPEGDLDACRFKAGVTMTILGLQIAFGLWE